MTDLELLLSLCLAAALIALVAQIFGKPDVKKLNETSFTFKINGHAICLFQVEAWTNGTIKISHRAAPGQHQRFERDYDL